MKTKFTILIFLVLSLALAGVLSRTQYVIEIKNEVLEAGIRTVTAYTLGRAEETDDSPCIGAYNDNLCELAAKGVKICASNEFPRGTILKIGELECVVLDRMNPKYKTEVDLAGLDYQKNLEFGRKELSVIIK